MRLLRRLPGVEQLEWELAQHGWTEENAAWAAKLSLEHFGLDKEDTEPFIDEEGVAWIGGAEVPVTAPEDFFKRCEEWERHFDVLRFFRDESDAFWASHGWDVTDGNGKQLESMSEFGRPMVCVVKRLDPDAEYSGSGPAGDAEDWGARLAEEARRFKSD